MLQQNDLEVYNWHSGWLQSENFHSLDNNYNYYYSIISVNISQILINNLPIIVGILAIGSISYVTYDFRRKSKTNKDLKFSDYFKEKTSKKSQKKTRQLIHVDKALEKLDIILNELPKND